jgi:biuret amidohydrolase
MTATMGWRERLSFGTEALPELDFDERHTALLIVDMQNYSANPDSSRGALLRRRLPEQANAYFARVRDTVVPNQQKLLGFWREHGLRVIYLTAGALLPDGSDLSERRRRRDAARLAASGLNEHMHPDTFDYQILDALQPRMDELVIRKNSIGAFNSSQIDQILRNMRITGLVIVGVITEGCVETTARDAADRGYDCILVEDGCASDMGDETHEASLLSFARMFGEVRTTADVLARFSAKIEVCS